MNQILLVFWLVFSASVTAQAYSLQGTDIVSGQMENIEAKGVVVAFLSAKCPCSNDHTGELSELAKAHPEFKFIGVHSNADESPEITKTYFTNKHLPFPVIQDTSFKIADQYKAFKTPHVFVIDGAGQTVYQGGVTDSKKIAKAERRYLREALDDLTQKIAVRTPQTRTLGCSISRN